MTPRREMGLAVAGTAAAGGLALSAGGQTWAEVGIEREPPLPPVAASVSGADVTAETAVGLVLLASAAALLAVRRSTRVILGGLIAGGGVALGWMAIRALTGGLEAAAAELARGGLTARTARVDVVAAWPVVTVVAGVLAVAAGALCALRGRAWPTMGRRFERGPGAAIPARDPTDADRASAAWQALDRGVDPTDAPDPDAPTDPPPGGRF